MNNDIKFNLALNLDYLDLIKFSQITEFKYTKYFWIKFLCNKLKVNFVISVSGIIRIVEVTEKDIEEIIKDVLEKNSDSKLKNIEKLVPLERSLSSSNLEELEHLASILEDSGKLISDPRMYLCCNIERIRKKHKRFCEKLYYFYYLRNLEYLDKWIIESSQDIMFYGGFPLFKYIYDKFNLEDKDSLQQFIENSPNSSVKTFIWFYENGFIGLNYQNGFIDNVEIDPDRYRIEVALYLFKKGIIEPIENDELMHPELLQFEEVQEYVLENYEINFNNSFIFLNIAYLEFIKKRRPEILYKEIERLNNGKNSIFVKYNMPLFSNNIINFYIDNGYKIKYKDIIYDLEHPYNDILLSLLIKNLKIYKIYEDNVKEHIIEKTDEYIFSGNFISVIRKTYFNIIEPNKFNRILYCFKRFKEENMYPKSYKSLFIILDKLDLDKEQYIILLETLDGNLSKSFIKIKSYIISKI